MTGRVAKNIVKRRIYRWWIFANLFASILMLLFVTGCASSRVNYLRLLDVKSVPQENEGLVIARVIDASGSMLPFNKLTITPENINESKDVKWQELPSLSPKLNGYTVFASYTKSGSYSLNSISSYFSNGEIYYTRFARASTKFGTFEVKPNQITDLGTIIYYTKPQVDRYLPMLVHLPEHETGEVLDKYFPFYQYDRNDVLGWNENELEEENQSNYLSIIQNPISFNKTYVSSDKSLYFLGNLGIIVRRSTLGDWQLDAVETNLALNAIAENKRGDLIVGGDEGRLFFKKRQGDWQDISFTFDNRILEMYFDKENSVTLLASNSEKLNVFRADISQTPLQWSRLNQFDTASGWNNTDALKITSYKQRNSLPKKKKKTKKDITFASLTEFDGKHYVKILTKKPNSSPIFSASSDFAFEFDSNSWLVSSIEHELEVTRVVSAGNVRIGIKEPGFWSLSGKNQYFRYIDQDKSWNSIKMKIRKCNNGELIGIKGCNKSDDSQKKKSMKTNNFKRFSFVSIPWFKNSNEAVAIVSFSEYNFLSDNSSSERKILVTSDGGKSWRDTRNNLPKDYCGSLITEVTDRLLLSCNGATGDFYESTDDGKNWKHVRQQENF